MTKPLALITGDPLGSDWEWRACSPKTTMI